MSGPVTGSTSGSGAAGGVPGAGQAPAPGSVTAPTSAAPGGNGATAAVWRPREVAPSRFSDALRSEWTKMRTVRSSYAAVGAAVILMVGLAALICLGVGTHYQRAGVAEHLTFDPTSISLSSITFAQLAISVFAILLVTSEYSTGMIRTTLQAVPRRPWLLGAKAVVFTAVSLVAGETMCFAAFFVGQPILEAGPAPHATIGQPGVARAVALAGVYLVLSGLLAMGVGVLLRHTAGAITIIVAVLFVLPGVANALPTSWQRPVQEFIPTGGGRAMASAFRDPNFLSPWWGLGLLCLYVAVVGGFAMYTMQRRDA